MPSWAGSHIGSRAGLARLGQRWSWEKGAEPEPVWRGGSQETLLLIGESRASPMVKLLARWGGKVRATVAVGVTSTEMIFEIRITNEDFKGEKSWGLGARLCRKPRAKVGETSRG